MAWDSRRTVPWRRLLIEWAVVVVGIALVSAVWGDAKPGELVFAAVFGGAIYLLFGAVMAKFGYARKSLRDLRAQAEQRAAAGGSGAGASGASRSPSRQRPAPTKRTSTGPSQHPRKKKR